MFIKAKSSISRLLKQSILELCKASVPHGQGLEIDGIVCVSFGEETDQIVVKVHERLGSFCTISDATSSEVKNTNPGGGRENENADENDPPDALSAALGRDMCTDKLDIPTQGFTRPIEVVPYDDAAEGEGAPGLATSPYIKRAAATPIWRQGKSAAIPAAVARSLVCSDKQRVILTPPKLPYVPGAAASSLKPQEFTPNGTKIKTEREDSYEEARRSPLRMPAAHLPPVSLSLSAGPNDGLTRRSEIVCEHCQLVCLSFEELKEHNDTAHGAYTCSYCWRSYLHYTNYALHLKRHRATPSRRNLPIEHVPRMSPIIPLSAKTGHKARCGVCGEATRTHTTMVQHLKSMHEFEHCFTCSTCMEYFPNRTSFIIHRRMTHTDVNQCRCERCDVFFTYVEFKVHERECSVSPTDAAPSLPPPSSDAQRNGADDREIPASDEPGADDSYCEKENMSSGFINRLLRSEDSLRDQVQKLKKQRLEKEKDEVEEDNEKETMESEDSDDEVGSIEDSAEPVCRNNHADKAERRDKPTFARDEDRDGIAALYYPLIGSHSRSPVESENSMESTKDLSQGPEGPLDSSLPSPATSSCSGVVHRQAIKSLESLGATCPGPFRCQSCFQISEQFEEYEMHCYEMHNRFVCPFCAQSFANKRNLHRHVRKHTGEMPYICVECGEKFYRDDDLRRHKMSKHVPGKLEFGHEEAKSEYGHEAKSEYGHETGSMIGVDA